MREKRNQLFNRFRFDLESHSASVQNTLTEIVRQEFQNLSAVSSDNYITVHKIDEPFTQEEAINMENEIVYEEEQWIIQEYEKILQDEVEYFAMYADNESREVFCPICQKAILTEENKCVNCPVCRLKLIGHTMQEVRYLINQSVNTHAFNCVQMPVFMVIPDNCNLNLYLVCHDCSTLALIC
ncbi:hypothetical protein PUN28_008169 [Cardiocondyla obscurior]